MRRVNVFKKVSGVSVGILAAVAGPGIVDRAIVVRTKKGAGALLYHIVAILIQAQVALYQLRFLDPEIFCYTGYIRRFKPRGNILAAAGAGQAVYFAKSLLMQLRQLLFYAPLLSRALQVLAVLFALVGRFFFPVVQEVCQMPDFKDAELPRENRQRWRYTLSAPDFNIGAGFCFKKYIFAFR